MKVPKDPGMDLYEILDKAKLNPAHLLASRAPMSKLVNEIRTTLVKELSEYIAGREASLGVTYDEPDTKHHGQ